MIGTRMFLLMILALKTSSLQCQSWVANTNEEFHRKRGYTHFGQFKIFDIEAAEIYSKKKL